MFRVKPFEVPIYVTRPVLPPKENFFSRVSDIWEAQWLTNMGEQHKEFEKKLIDVLKVPYLSIFNNGMNALLAAIRSLGIYDGEIITTPFTFAATPHSISWNGITPVFCDIDPIRMTLDPECLEPLITEKTRAILPVHVFGTVCDVHRIEKIAQKHGLKVLYDGAHVFGTEIDGVGIGNFGDITMFSFHATKLFHSAEGGALTCKDLSTKKEIDELKNFGIISEDEVRRVGLNGKMNEIQAALGLCVLEEIEHERKERERIKRTYIEELKGIDGISFLPDIPGVKHSLQYFVIRIDGKTFGRNRDYVYEELKKYNVFARKYFYPLCSNFACYSGLVSASPDNLPVANRVVNETLSMPFYGALSDDDITRICTVIKTI